MSGRFIGFRHTCSKPSRAQDGAYERADARDALRVWERRRDLVDARIELEAGR